MFDKLELSDEMNKLNGSVRTVITILKLVLFVSLVLSLVSLRSSRGLVGFRAGRNHVEAFQTLLKRFLMHTK